MYIFLLSFKQRLNSFPKKCIFIDILVEKQFQLNFLITLTQAIKQKIIILINYSKCVMCRNVFSEHYKELYIT